MESDSETNKESMSVSNWCCDDVGKWLTENGFQKYVEKFKNDHEIDGQVLLSLTEQDLRDPPMSIRCLGDIKRLSFKISALQSQNKPPPRFFPREPIPFRLHHESRSRERSQPYYTNNYQGHNVGRRFRQNRQYSTESEDFDMQSDQAVSRNGHRNISASSTVTSQEIPAELWKTALSFGYIFGTFLVTAFIMVVVHDRVPEMDKYPPLPDLFLDNMPYVSWAFDACEMVGLILSVMWFTLLFFHKHRLSVNLYLVDY